MNTSDQPMLARRQLRLAVVASLGTICNTVSSPGNWPTPVELLPALLISVPTESKSSLGRNVPEFNTSASIVIQGQVTATTPEAAQDEIELLAYQVENAVLMDYSVNQMIQQFVTVQTETEITSEGKQHLAGFRMTIVAEMHEAFDPMLAPAVDSTWPIVPAATVQLAGVNVHLDAANVFDPSGTYSNPTFPTSVNPAPRTSGPDGRDEGALQITLPQ